MDQSSNFELFPRLPEELRIQIWTCALPGPRIIDLKLENSTGTPLWERHRTTKGPWFWYTPTSTVTFPLLQVNQEARNVTLEAYKQTTIRQRDGSSWRPAYIDFKRDTIFRACYIFDPLFQFDLAHDVPVCNGSSWSNITTKLALHLSIIQRNFEVDGAGGVLRFENFNHLDGRKHAIRSLRTALMHFPAVRELWLVIDGRDERFGGDKEIVEPLEVRLTDSRPDDYVRAQTAVSLIVKDFAMQFPDLSLPQIKLGLLMNGRDTKTLWRVWFYSSARCGFFGSSTPQESRNSWVFRARGDISSESSDSEEDYDIGIFTESTMNWEGTVEVVSEQLLDQEVFAMI